MALRRSAPAKRMNISVKGRRTYSESSLLPSDGTSHWKWNRPLVHDFTKLQDQTGSDARTPHPRTCLRAVSM
jgi:hypothetical protein